MRAYVCICVFRLIFDTHKLQNWGFDGFVLSDLGAVQFLWNLHAVAESPADAIRQYLTAGGNMQFYDFPNDQYEQAIVDLVENGSKQNQYLQKQRTN